MAPVIADGRVRTTAVEPLNDFESIFLRHMRAEGLAEQTIRHRLYTLRRLGPDPLHATSDDVLSALEGDLKQATRATYLQALRACFSDLQRMGLIDHDPTARVRLPKSPRRSPRPLPEAELEQLLTMDDETARAWTILGAYAGLRIGEVSLVRGCHLERSDRGRILRIPYGKGGLDASIPAHPRIVEALQPYAEGQDRLWPWWPSAMARRWRAAAASVGIEGRVFHQLRHTYATRLYKATGGDLLTVASLCRHSSVATTQKYAAIADDRPFDAMQLIA